MPEQNPTVPIGSLAYVDVAPTVISASVRHSFDEERLSLRLATNAAETVDVWLPHAAWAQVIPLLVGELPEPARSQAIAAVAQLGAEAVSA